MALTRIDIGHDGTVGRQHGGITLSAQGRWQAFTGFGDDMIGLSGTTAFVRDSVTGVIEAVAFTLNGEMVADAYQTIISADGRYVIYTSAQNDIVAGDTNGTADVFRYDRVTKTTALVSKAMDGGVGNGESFANEISADGRYVAFTSHSSNLTTGVTDTITSQQYLRDMVTGETIKLTRPIDASGSGLPIDRQEAWSATSITQSGGVAFQYHQYFHHQPGYDRDGGLTPGFGGETTIHDNAIVFTSAAGDTWVSQTGLSFELRAFLPGDDPLKVPVLRWSKVPWDNYVFMKFAEGGRYVVTAMDIDPATGAVAPGIYVWDLHDRSQTAVGSFRKVADIASTSHVGWVDISADGSFITFATWPTDMWGEPIANPVWGQAWGAANPFGGTWSGGIIEIAKPAQWLITGGNDAAVGTSTHDEIHLLGGHDRAWGAAGDDRIWGDDGDDQIWGNIGEDTLRGGAGDDTLDGGEHDDRLYGGADDDTLYGGEGADVLYGEDDDDVLFGEGGADQLYGGDGHDTLWGGEGNDTLTGGAGDDVLHGGGGDETFHGEAGDDVIDGGTDGDGQDVDVLRLTGSAADYDLRDEDREVGGTLQAVTTMRSDATGFDIVMNIEEARFDHLRTNAIAGENVYLTLAKAADAAYTTDQFVDGWKPLTSLELGIARSGVINDPESVTSWTYANGFYSATGPGRINGATIEAAAQVSFAVVDGKTTLMVAIRGTDDIRADGQDYPQFQWHYDRFKPLIDAVLQYVANGGYAEGGRIDQVWVAGHSLGGATVQQMLQDPRIFGDDRFLAATFGAPGSESNRYDPRIVHFEHSADIVPLAGDMARLAHGNWSPIYNYFGLERGRWIDAFIESNLDPTEFWSAGDSVRISTHGGVSLDPLSQHSMETYVASLTEMAKHPEWHPVLTQGSAGIPGAPGNVRIALGTDAADTLVGQSADFANHFRFEEFFDGSERLFGGRGRDMIRGGAGRDAFEGTLTELNGDTIHDLTGGETIRVWGGRPITQIEVGYSYDAENDRGTLNIAGAEITLEGRHVGDFVVHQRNGHVDIVFVGKAWVSGTDGDDELGGGDGDDVLSGKAGHDVLLGGDGNDTLFGDASGGAAGLRALAGATDGDDVLDGGLGADILTGGGGSDTFVIGIDAADTVTDFAAGYGGDRLDVSALVASLGTDVDPFIGGYLRLIDNGAGGTSVILDADGSAGSGAGRLVATLDGVVPDALSADNFKPVGDIVVDPANGLPLIAGSNERDYLEGTDASERIIGHGFGDVIFGGGGNDTIYVDAATWGNVSVPGEQVGVIPAEFADYDMDVAFGGDGNDTLVNHALYAEMHGGDGDDVLTGSYGHHYLYGDAGNDRFIVDQGYYSMWGGSGADLYIVRGANSAAVMDFAVGEDRIDLTGSGIMSFEQLDFEVRNGWLSVAGITLKDVRVEQLTAQNFIFDRVHERGIVRATGAVVASPRPDLDKHELFRVDGGGVTEVIGGHGADRFYFGDAYRADIKIDGGSSSNTILLQGDYTGARAVRIDPDNAIGIDGFVLLSGGDARYGRAGGSVGYHVVIDEKGVPSWNFLVDGGMLAAHERLVFDATVSEYANLEVIGGDADDEMRGGGGREEFEGGAGADRLFGNAGNDYLAGGDGDDLLDGGNGNDALYGEFGLDILDGGDGDDELHGGVADQEWMRDELSGGAGNDILHASSGALMNGGSGSDSFRIDTLVRDAVILDFSGGDVLDLHGLIHRLAGTNEVDAVRENLVRLVQDGANVIVQANRDGWLTVATMVGVDLAALGASNVLGISLPGKVESGGDDGNVFQGGTGSDSFTGGAGTDLFWLQDGGHDQASGGAGDDGFFFGGSLDALDMVDGGAGGQDQLGIRGDYSTPLLLGERNLVGIETLVLISGSDTRFGGSASDRFTYNLKSIDANVVAGGTLAVTMNTLRADEAVTFDGSWETDGSFHFFGGWGRDVLTGGAQADGFYFGDDGRFGASDRINGGGGTDQLGLQGNVTIAFGANQISDVEVIVLLSAGDGRFGGAGSGYHYDLTLHDTIVREGRLTVTGNMLAAHETMRIDGAAETDGMLTLYGGQGADTLIGGAQNDLIYGGLGADVLTGGGGADTFLYVSGAQSTAAAHDRITDFDFAVDLLDLVGTAADYHRSADARVSATSLAGLDAALTTALDGVLGARGVSVVRGEQGPLAGHVFVVVDQNGVDGYQGGEDLVIDVGIAANLPATDLGFIV